jgi:hypothetical protein
MLANREQKIGLDADKVKQQFRVVFLVFTRVLSREVRVDSRLRQARDEK